MSIAIRLAKKIEEQRAPLFIFRDIVIGVFASIHAGGGFGNKFYTEASCISVFILLFPYISRLKLFILGAVLLFCVLQPALMQSPMLLAVILVSNKQTKNAIVVLLGSGLQLIGGYNPYYLPIYIIPIVVIAATPYLKLRRNPVQIVGLILIGINLIPTLVNHEAPKGHQEYDLEYRIDIRDLYGSPNHDNTYTSINDSGDYKSANVIVLEHDPLHGLAFFNWSQKRLWTENQYYGAPLLRIATALDGFLYSNLGCRVDGFRLRLLGEANHSEHNHYISRTCGKLVFSDSDFLTNGAIGYQKNLIDSLFSEFSVAHIILYGTSICFVISLLFKRDGFALALMLILSISIYIITYIQPIDIRICDTVEPWPHSKGVGGIATGLSSQHGIKTVSRIGCAQILCIARSASGVHRNEKVIVLEGGSSVEISNVTFEAIDLPMGECKGVFDAIPLRKRGDNQLGDCIQNFENVIIIGTNSAKKNSKMIYEASK
jgi:hypothetical protein